MTPALNTTASGWRRVSGLLALVGLVALLLADLEITRVSPGHELLRISQGFLSPDFSSTDFLWRAVVNTLAFAGQGTALGALAGFAMAVMWHWRAVRAVAASVRAVHELFWGLLLLQLTGLSTVTAVLAIAIPYSGIFAKVFGEFLEEADPAPAAALPAGSRALSVFFFARLPLVWQAFKAYGSYRLECAIRASAILGFIGLPTLGFHLETAFREGHYDQGAALLYLFFLIIFTLRWWLRPTLPYSSLRSSRSSSRASCRSPTGRRSPVPWGKGCRTGSLPASPPAVSSSDNSQSSSHHSISSSAWPMCMFLQMYWNFS